MANVHNMLPDTREREKIVGGILDSVQLFWIALGFILYIIFVFIFFKLLRGFAFFFGIPLIVFGFVFALKKVNDMSLAKYLKYKKRYKKTVHYYINSGFHSDLEFSGTKGEE